MLVPKQGFQGANGLCVILSSHHHHHHDPPLDTFYSPEGNRKRVLPLPLTVGTEYFETRESIYKFIRERMDCKLFSPYVLPCPWRGHPHNTGHIAHCSLFLLKIFQRISQLKRNKRRREKREEGRLLLSHLISILQVCMYLSQRIGKAPSQLLISLLIVDAPYIHSTRLCFRLYCHGRCSEAR